MNNIDFDNRLYNALKKIYTFKQFDNADLCIVGSVALYLQDIKYDREIHDIDIKVLNDTKEHKIKYQKYFNICKIKYGFKLDFLFIEYEDIIPEYHIIELNDIKVKVMDIKSCIKYKEKILEIENYQYKEKHINDLKYIYKNYEQLLS